MDDIDGFKMAGGFNSDWDLSVAAVALILAKHAISGATDTTALREQAPSWDEWTKELKRKGGGPVVAEQSLLQMMDSNQRREYALKVNAKRVVQLCQEIYAGDDACEMLYGFEPEILHDEGLYNQEKVILDKNFLPNLPLGILTGRTLSETKMAMKMARLQIPQEHWITETDGIRKPDGHTLLMLQERMKFKNAVFIGDTWDDWQTVVNYRTLKGAGRARVSGCMALAGANAAQHRRTFLEAGTEILTPNANTFLAYLKHVLK